MKPAPTESLVGGRDVAVPPDPIASTATYVQTAALGKLPPCLEPGRHLQRYTKPILRIVRIPREGEYATRGRPRAGGGSASGC